MVDRLQVMGKLKLIKDRTGFRKQHKARTLILELERDDINQYYHWFLSKKFGTGFKLQPPMFGNHVTIVKGTESIDEPIVESILDKFSKHYIWIEYLPEIAQHWKFFYLPVKSRLLQDIRIELGLNVVNEFHLTIGRLPDYKPEKRFL